VLDRPRMGVRASGQADETGAHLPEFGRSGLVVAALGGLPRLAVAKYRPVTVRKRQCPSEMRTN